jgi:hypothetical protein
MKRLPDEDQPGQVPDPADLADACPGGYEDVRDLCLKMGLSADDLLALTQGRDPFYAGRPSDLRDARWFAALWHNHGGAKGVHLRRLHYQLVSARSPVPLPDGTPCENTERCWDQLQAASCMARHLEFVEAEDFEDRRNPGAMEFADYGEGIPDAACQLDECSGWTLPRIDTHLGDRLDFDLPTPEVSGYEATAGDQPFHLEVWSEKSTMNDVLVPLCRRWGVNLVTALGFQSITGAVRLLGRVRSVEDLLRKNQRVRIFYICDFDPAGRHMPVGVARAIEFYLRRMIPGADVGLTPLLLTRGQVEQYDLPRVPIKDEDRRKASFEARHGEGAVELDALEALHPGELARLVEQAIAPYRDEELCQELEEAGQEAREKAEEDWEEITQDVRQELEEIRAEAATVYDRYREKLKELSEQLNADLAPLATRLDAAWQSRRRPCPVVRSGPAGPPRERP